MFQAELNRWIEKKIEEGINFTITMVGDSGVIVEGHKGILSYHDDEIILKLNKNYISIRGEKLTISEINDVDIFIMGKIAGVNFDNGK